MENNKIKFKTCTKCKEELLATPEFFSKAKKGKYGLTSRCKTCKNKYYAENKDEINRKHREYGKEYRARPESKAKRLEYDKQYYANPVNQEKMKKSANIYRDTHKQEETKRRQKYMSDPVNREKANKTERERRRSSSEYKEKRREYKARNRERIKEQDQEYSSRPEVKEKRTEYLKEYNSDPANCERRRQRELPLHGRQHF